MYIVITSKNGSARDGKKYYVKKQKFKILNLRSSVDSVGDSVILVNVIRVVALKVSNLNIT